MVDPMTALLVALLVASVLAVLLWPERGLLWRLTTVLRAGERVQTEDALKHLYDCEYQQIPCTLNSLSGALGLSSNRTAGLASRLLQLRLVAVVDGAYRLSNEGRSYALRVIRIHRLWERYLSDVTSVDPVEWHTMADRMEHKTTPEQARLLAARTGYPRYDPHGDPIPSAEGDLPPAQGMPLTGLEIGQRAEVVHIEDEPQAVYAQLVAAGMKLGTRVQLIESTPERLRLEAGGEEYTLAPVVAANLSVVPLAQDAAAEPSPGETLASLQPGERATVAAIGSGCRGLARRRLLDLGVLPGSEVEAEMRSPSGDPTAYRVRGALIALRREQAVQILIEREPAAVGVEATA